MVKFECNICGDDLSELGQLGYTICPHCELLPICTYCIKIHEPKCAEEKKKKNENV